MNMTVKPYGINILVNTGSEMTCRLLDAHPLAEPMLTYFHISDAKEHVSMIFLFWNSKVLIEDNAFQTAVYKMAAILSWPWCVN